MFKNINEEKSIVTITKEAKDIMDIFKDIMKEEIQQDKFVLRGDDLFSAVLFRMTDYSVESIIFWKLIGIE